MRIEVECHSNIEPRLKSVKQVSFVKRSVHQPIFEIGHSFDLIS